MIFLCVIIVLSPSLVQGLFSFFSNSPKEEVIYAPQDAGDCSTQIQGDNNVVTKICNDQPYEDPGFIFSITTPSRKEENEKYYTEFLMTLYYKTGYKLSQETLMDIPSGLNCSIQPIKKGPFIITSNNLRPEVYQAKFSCISDNPITDASIFTVRFKG